MRGGCLIGAVRPVGCRASSGYGLISAHNIHTIEMGPASIRCHTTNGAVFPHGKIVVLVSGLPGRGSPLVLDRMPHVLTVGPWCMGEELSLSWGVGKRSVLIAHRELNGLSASLRTLCPCCVVRPPRWARGRGGGGVRVATGFSSGYCAGDRQPRYWSKQRDRYFPADPGVGMSLKPEAQSLPHLLTYWQTSHCQLCQIAKGQRRPARRLGLGPRLV